MAALFTALLAVSAFIAVPVGSVPFTLQVYVVLTTGLLLGPRLGVLSVTAYLALGLVAPVYSGGASGIGALIGPTGGYLIGFVGGALVVGLLARKSEASVTRLVAAGLAGLVPIYVLGAAWLALQLGLGARAAFASGVAPFIWVDILKAVAAALTAKALISLPLGLPAELRRGR